MSKAATQVNWLVLECQDLLILAERVSARFTRLASGWAAFAELNATP